MELCKNCHHAIVDDGKGEPVHEGSLKYFCNPRDNRSNLAEREVGKNAGKK